MKLQFVTLATLLFGLSTASKLSTKYLPPNYAGSSAGHGSFLQGPHRQQVGGARPSQQYLAPQSASGQHYHAVSGSHSAAAPQYAVAASAPVASTYGHNRAAAQIPTLRQDYTNDGNGNYNFGFETGNGIRRDETGKFQGGWPHGSQTVSGSYSYTGDDGHVYTVNYKADGNGFQATGDHLPTPPPVPREIQESLALHHSGRPSHQGGATYGGAAHAGAASYAAGAAAHGGAGYNYGNGGHQTAASVQSPSARYLPPQRRH